MTGKLKISNSLRLLLGVLPLILSFQICAIFETPERVDISVEAPVTVSQGERFQLLVRVANTASSTQVLVDLDIADEYLEGLVVESSLPMFSDSRHIPLDNTISYSYDIPIESGEEIEVIFEVFAAKVGDFSGDIDFCINDEASCLSHHIRTIVE